MQYGHNVTLSTGRSALVLDAVIEDGNPADTTRYLPMLKRDVEQYGVPESVATDGGYANRRQPRGSQGRKPRRSCLRRGDRVKSHCWWRIADGVLEARLMPCVD